jgi:hypothetical protein
MTVISWEKPKQIMSAQEREETYIADSAPPGVYFPNMSATDIKRWKGKIVGSKTKRYQIEVRKDTAVFIFGGAGGYKYKQYNVVTPYAFHVGASGAIQWTATEVDEFLQVVAEARAKLRELEQN